RALAVELCLEPREDVVAAVQIRDGAALVGSLRERAFLVSQPVVEGDDLVLCDFHGGELEPIRIAPRKRAAARRPVPPGLRAGRARSARPPPRAPDRDPGARRRHWR